VGVLALACALGAGAAGTAAAQAPEVGRMPAPKADSDRDGVFDDLERSVCSLR
jgi:hypothetical protein